MIVADDGSRDRTAEAAEAAGARVVRLPRRGKGQALALGERAAAPGRLLLCDADLAGELRPLLESKADLAIAVFAEQAGGGFGLVKRSARELLGSTGRRAARAALGTARTFARRTPPLLPARGRLRLRRAHDPRRSRGRADGRGGRAAASAIARPAATCAGSCTGRAARDVVLGFGPLGVNHRGLRLPLVGWVVGALGPRVAAVAALGLADDLWSGPERGFGGHLRAGPTTGVLKLVGIPLVGLLATRRLSGALLVGLAANALNQLDTRPGRALKAYAAPRSRSARRSRPPSSSLHTISGRWRCSGTRGRTRSARC